MNDIEFIRMIQKDIVIDKTLAEFLANIGITNNAYKAYEIVKSGMISINHKKEYNPERIITKEDFKSAPLILETESIHEKNRYYFGLYDVKQKCTALVKYGKYAKTNNNNRPAPSQQDTSRQRN